MPSLRSRRDSGADVRTPEDFSQYAGHTIRLEYEQVSRGGLACTDWVLFVDEHMLYLGHDAMFVRQVLGQDFAAFIHEAFRRAGIATLPPSERLAGDFDRDLLRASLACGVVQGLNDSYAIEGEDFFEVLHGLDPWSLTVQ
jgi:hypothetical protein